MSNILKLSELPHQVMPYFKSLQLTFSKFLMQFSTLHYVHSFKKKNCRQLMGT